MTLSYYMGLPVTLGTYNLKNTESPLAETVVPMPAGSDFIEAVASPDQRRIIWQIGFATTTELWISEAKGKDMRRLAAVSCDPETEHSNLELPLADVRWMQDASAIAWRRGQAMYVATVA